MASMERTLSWAERIQQIQSVPSSEVPAETLETLYEDMLDAMSAALDDDKLSSLAPSQKEDRTICLLLATCENTPEDVLMSLMSLTRTEFYLGFYSALTGNTGASSEVLLEAWDFLRRNGYATPYHFPSHPNCPPEVLEGMSKDNRWGFRKIVASNPNTPVPILVKMLNDRQGEVSQVAEETLSRLPQFTGYPLEWIIASANDVEAETHA